MDRNQVRQKMSRREMLWRSGIGFGGLALCGLIADEERAALASAVAANPLAVRPPHFESKAKRVIFLFMHGGPSQVDTFDYKPQLEKDNGKELPFAKPRVVSSKTGGLLKSPWGFKQYGQSGIHVSDLFPQVGACIDDICLINSMWCSNSRHGSALLELHTGSDTFVRPSMGSWINYGLGTENQDLPGFITMCPTFGHGGVNAWSSAFLPAVYQGTAIGAGGGKVENAKIPFITNVDTPPAAQRRELDLLNQLNTSRLQQTGPDSALEARINSFELAFRMQSAVPGVQDISGESQETLRLYGVDQPSTENFGRQCLMARRFAERGVRFVQVSHGYWDQHGGLAKDHQRIAGEVDRPIAGLLTDLKRRGLLDETLVVWGGEFGRTPTSEGNDGRDHNPQGYTMWLAGGGIKGGLRYGETDEYGYYAVKNKVHLHDLHATILHQLGLDHTKLTYQYAGRNFRLTDVQGDVVREILA
jgi:hypothetical protein